ncbi:putative short-chain alcohol dehydrogenase [Mollisia scopiformis]|uniref:Putative short-chain alcohol dehydrogenase n=1 Tax=Mollisia scopiformis TaxID=149040 RepID=A0A194WYQ9_MOLSC|nr:putative short-chain alcohol dehydrogenase [Mollisia scopiformis]KUJ13098.1 putative short-chain alcohol dehydrogenase [Mollisia scopiformis]
MAPTLLMIGSGPGIGLSTASLFASKKFSKVALISRNKERLVTDREAVLAAAKNTDVKTWVADVVDSEKYKNVLKEVEEWSGEGVDCVIFNAARVEPSTLLEFPEEEIVKDFMTTNIALYTTAQWALPLLSKMKEEQKPSFLVTSSLLWKQPVPFVFSLSLVKASQRNLVETMKMTFPDIHIALLNVGGVVSPEDTYLNPPAIAEKFWELYAQEKSAWTFDLEILGAQ